MLETLLRSRFERYFVDSMVMQCAQKNISPQAITLLGGIFGCITLMLLCMGHKGGAVLFLLLSGYCDVVDGCLARKAQRTQVYGAVFDIVMDRVVEFLVVLGLFFCDPLHRGLLTLGMLGSVLLCVTSFLVVGIFSPNTSEKSFHYSVGLMERAEAFGFFIAMILFPSYFTVLAVVFIVLVLFTTVMRLYQFWQNHSQSAQLSAF